MSDLLSHLPTVVLWALLPMPVLLYAVGFYFFWGWFDRWLRKRMGIDEAERYLFEEGE